MLRLCCGMWFLAFISVISSAQDFTLLLNSLPSYRPRRQVSGTIRIWGHRNQPHDFTGGLVKRWEESFRKYQPEVTFETQLRGNASAIGGLYTMAADVAFMSREIWPIETDGFEQGLGYKPFSVEVATGSLANPNQDFALVIFVHRDNPLSRMTLAQLDAIFGADHRRGLKSISAWGDLGLRGEWEDKPVDLYGFAIDSDFSQFFEQAVLNGSRKWNCKLREFTDTKNPDGSRLDAGRQILDALAKDRYGIAISGLAYGNASVKPIAIGSDKGGPYYLATPGTLIDRKYPLARTPYLFVRRAPGQPIDPKIDEFLHFVLSREGQEGVIRDGGYLPLNGDAVRRQREKLQ
jgi:phosphate transport system substrate-binding protein